ncbi:hypothetical protein MY1884_008413 [Beauveria asiatica]
MGASQSTSQGNPGPSSTTTKTCYYELIGVDRDASETDIKKAYRKRALELHPDRNLGDVAAATHKFAELQSAYDILSDSHERSWYDAHRDAILIGQDITGDGAEPTSIRNVRLTSAEEIMSLIRKFNSSIPFNDDPIGFFSIARETFEHLALEEEAAAAQENVDAIDYASFGQSEDTYEEVVKPFYASWAGFATKKTFSWKDKYRLSDAPERQVRRLMDKENKKLREDAARGFNEAVRFLVAFVRKRDPRYLPNLRTEAQRQEASRVAAAAQAARSRAANIERMADYEVPNWATSRDTRSDGGDFSSSEVESEVEILECVVCDKNFKSEKQLEAHERSKKHLKAVQQLWWQMRKDGVELQLNDDPAWAEGHGHTAALGDRSYSPNPADANQELPPSSVSIQADSEFDEDPAPSAGHSDVDDNYAPRDTIINRMVTGQLNATDTPTQPLGICVDDLSTTASSMTIDPGIGTRKVGKAKAKRERKAKASQHGAGSKEFDSRTKLFAHLRVDGHATAPSIEDTQGRRNKKR